MSPRLIGALIAAVASVVLTVFSCGTPVPAAPLPHVTPSPMPQPCPMGGTRCR